MASKKKDSPEEEKFTPSETQFDIEYGTDIDLPFSTPFSPSQSGLKKTETEELREVLNADTWEGPTIRQLVTMRRQDGQARALYNLLTLPIRSALSSSEILPEDGGEEEAEFIRQIFFTPPEAGGMTVTFQRFMSQVLSGLFNGFAAFEKVFWRPTHGPLKGKITLKKLAYRPAETVTFVTDEKGSYRGFRQRTFADGKTLDAYIPKEYSFYFAAKEEERKFYGVSFFESAFYHYDKKCLTGDTLIPLLDNTSATIAEITQRVNAGESVWVYGYRDGRVVPAQVAAAEKTGTKATVKVTLDNGESFRCTPDHRIMLRDGSYVEAKDLTPGTSLMSLPKREEPLGKPDSEQVNHKVVSVVADAVEDVYDIQVPATENFAINSGVFVHNCRIYYIAHLAAQRAAVGTRVGKIPESATPSQKAAFARALQSIATAQWMTLDNGFDVEMLSEGGSFDFINFVNHHNSQMSKTVLAAFFDSNQGSGQGEGSLVNFAKPGDGMYLMMLRTIMDDIASQINHYIIPQLIDLNFDSGKYPKFSWGKLTDEQRGAIATTFDKVATAGQNINLTPEFIRALEVHQAKEFGLEIDYDEVEEREAEEEAVAVAQALGLNPGMGVMGDMQGIPGTEGMAGIDPVTGLPTTDALVGGDAQAQVEIPLDQMTDEDIEVQLAGPPVFSEDLTDDDISWYNSLTPEELSELEDFEDEYLDEDFDDDAFWAIEDERED